MSDSHKLSFLDLQIRDLSQYGKKNLDRADGASRNLDSSYRKQLSESLSKKQSSSTSERIQESESESRSIQSNNNRSEKKQSSSESSTNYREDQLKQEKSHQSESAGISEEAKAANSSPESSETISDSKSEEKTEVAIEATEEQVNTQPEAKLNVKDQKPPFSLFDSSLTAANEEQYEQVVFTDSSEIQPPANLQLVEDTTIVNLPSEVTETGDFESLPVPEGLADILKSQDVSVSQTEINQQAQDAANKELNSDLEINETLPSSVVSESLESKEKASSLIEELPPIQETKELQQAIQKFNEQQPDDSFESESEKQARIQAELQQRYLRSGDREQSGSSTEKNNSGEIQLDSEAVLPNSKVVTEPVQQASPSELPETVNEKTIQAEQNTEEVDFNPGKPIQNQAAVPETQNRIQTDATKVSALAQDSRAVIDSDQSVLQPTGLSQSIPTMGTQGTTPSGTPVDVNQAEQLVERIVSSVQQSQSTGQQLKIRLSPPELGTLQIEVSLKNGQYTARLEVQNNQAQKVINDNIAQLRDALVKSGVAIDRIDVHINTDASEDQRSSHSDERSQFSSDYDSNQFSENSGDAEQRPEERAFVEESIQQDDSEQSQDEKPQVIRSQGIATENVEEIDVQI